MFEAPKQVKQISEASIQAKILRYLNDLPAVYAVKIHSGSKSGVPDILASINGRFVAIEVKRLGKHKVSPLQEATIRRINATNGIAFIAQSVEEVENKLKEILQCNQ